MLYASLTPAMAMLEFLVHTIGTPGVRDAQLITIDIPTRRLPVINIDSLETGWDSPLGIPQTRKLGDSFVSKGRSLAIKVPAAILPSAFNFLINPQHKLADKLTVVEVTPLALDPRFFRDRKA